ncbi:hypothetical protein ACIP5L_30085 [Streptomyces bacillaris]|uniref:hypothetical protein n=1 Tax=Streptomyces bacillaris TaxID=68179 RepID=UPI003810772A
MKSKTIGVTIGTFALLALGSGVAHAEGDWSGTIGGWLTGKESRHWEDKNRDAVGTSVKLSKCKTESATFRSATLQLKKERGKGMPDPVIARHDNTCNTSSFGRQGSGKYYFNLSRINGSDNGNRLWASVTVKY